MSLKTHYENTSSEELQYRLNLMNWVENTTTHYSQVLFDPILTPIFTTIFGAATIGATGITVASVATAIATTAITIGLQFLLAPKPPTPEAARVPLKQAIPYRIWGVGRTRLAGALMLWESKGPVLFAVQAVAGHRIKSFNRYWLHDDEVTLSGGGVAYSPTGRYGGNVTIHSRIGLPTETAYSDIVALFAGDPDPIWTSNHRGDGQASLAMLASADRQKDQNWKFPYGVPSLSAEADLALCWDFRDPAQDPENPATWQWTRNCAVILCWHLCFNEFGFGLDYRKAILPVIDMWGEEADVCDEAVPLAGGGTEPRYQCNGSDTTENGPKSALNAMLAACDGHLVARGDGARILTVGKFRESRCVTLSDADIIGHNIQYGVYPQDEINRIVPKFTYPETGYTTCDTDYFEDVPAQLTAGRVLAQDGVYQWVHRWRQARRLALRDWRRIQEKVKGSIDVRLSGINAVYARWVRLATPVRMPRLDGKIIENRKSTLALTNGGFNMEIMQHPDNIDAWVPATDEGTQPPVPTPPGSYSIPTPIINLVQAKPNGASVYIRVVLVDPATASLTPVIRYRLADNGSGSPGAWVEQTFPNAAVGVPVPGFIDLNTNIVPSDKLLDVQAYYLSSGGTPSLFSVTANIISTADPNAPGVATGVSATGGVGQATFNWTSPNSPNYVGSNLYWNTTNTITGATQVSPPEYGAPSTADSRVVTGISAGTRYGFVRPFNSSGVMAAAVSTGAFTVT
ncbi:hypothetical protein [Pararhizobium sp. DWP1-1-3]|uniref:hypothetical protein n=1 Tax=Pararhizobium sp. DWP1-1-3 TaxID=2804652 RepID=UPI003CF93929